MRSVGEIENVIKRTSMYLLGQKFNVCLNTRTFMGLRTLKISITYKAKCNVDGELKDFCGREYLIPNDATDDQIIKTIYTAFEAAVKHEIMEGFKVDGVVLFDPHVDFKELLKINQNREQGTEQHRNGVR